MEIGSRDLLRELSSFSDEIKKLTSSYKFKNDSKTVKSGFILFFIGGILSDSHQLNQVLVFEFLHNVEFMLKGWKVGSFFLIAFNSYKISVVIHAKFYPK